MQIGIENIIAKIIVKSNDDISEDVIVEILSRLPVKSLLRYRCACEFWYALIKSPRLISRHLKNYNDDNSRLAVNYVNASVYNEPTYVLFPDETLTNLSSHEILEPLSNNCQELLGPYYGLFCFHDKNLNRMFLRNVATREFRAHNVKKFSHIHRNSLPTILALDLN